MCFYGKSCDQVSATEQVSATGWFSADWSRNHANRVSPRVVAIFTSAHSLTVINLFQSNCFSKVPVTVLTNDTHCHFEISIYFVFTNRLKFILIWGPVDIKKSKHCSSYSLDYFSKPFKYSTLLKCFW